MKVLVSFSCYLVVMLFATARADIDRWDNSQLIPGAEGISTGPGVLLNHHELSFVALSGQDLTGARFNFSILTSASLYDSKLTNANLAGANLTNAFLTFSTLINADLTGAKLADAYLGYSTLTNANLTGAVVTGASFGETTFRGSPRRSSRPPLASYQTKNLEGIGLSSNDLTGSRGDRQPQVPNT